MSSRAIRIASRGSRLALRQTQIVADLLHGIDQALSIEIVTVTTRGDKDQRAFTAIGGKGLFTSEVERALVSGDADLAVHSAKDLTAELAEGCAIAAVPERGAPNDVVIGGSGDTGDERLASLPARARVGSSSMRRRALLAEARPDLEPVEFRGNLDTRMRKVADGAVDAAILAAAGVARLGLEGGGTLDPDWWVPAPGQGALAIEAREDRDDLIPLLSEIDDRAAHAALLCERSFARTLEGGCSVPLGCLARVSGDRLIVTGFRGSPHGGQGLRDRVSGALNEAEALGSELAHAILDAGGRDILDDLRDVEVPNLGAPRPSCTAAAMS